MSAQKNRSRRKFFAIGTYLGSTCLSRYMYAQCTFCKYTGTLSNGEETKRIMRRIKENQQQKMFRFFSGFSVWLQLSHNTPTALHCCINCAVMRVRLIYSSNRPSGMNEICSAIHTRNMQQHRLNTFVVNHMLHNRNARAHTGLRSPLCAGDVYFLFITFSSLFGRKKSKKKHENERRYESSSFSFQRSTSAHVCARSHTKFRCARHILLGDERRNHE